MVGIAVLAALVVVLQLLSSVIKIGTVSITLTLIPIVVGAAFYGPGAGAILGTVFGLVVYINSATGADTGGNLVFLANPFLCAVVCIGKGTLSGWCAGLVYRLVARKDAALGRNAVAVLLAAITAPVVNTGVFLLGMVLFFQETLRAWAAGSALLTYALFTLAGVNFLVELGLNLVLSPAVSTLIRAIDPSLDIRTGEISESHHKGRHTTTFSTMYPLAEGGAVIDTPGIKGFGLIDIDDAELWHYFPEMMRTAPDCRFYNCTHTHEPGCAVVEAVERGQIAYPRYESYLKILDEDEKYRK